MQLNLKLFITKLIAMIFESSDVDVTLQKRIVSRRRPGPNDGPD
jgi:hypothetical protein